jgi:fermentation-respiration switch protein FrsA (DUF1100 family)
MALLHLHRPETDANVQAEPLTPGRRTPYRCWLTAAEGVALAALVGYRGTPGWQSLRVILVVLPFAVAFWLQRTRTTWVASVTSVIVGVVGVIAGIAVGVTHLVKSGALVPTAAGLVVLATGLALLIAGCVALVRLLPGRWRLLAIPAVYVLIEFVLFPLTTGVYAANVPADHLGSANPSSHGLTYSTVSFEAKDGVRLAGWYVPSHNGAAVIVAAGSGSTRADVLDQGSVLARHGYGVLFIDNRGHGTSGGTAMDFGWWGERDLYGAVSFLERRPDVTNGRIAVLGESMGGEEAIGAIGSDNRVRAAIAEGVTGRTFADTARLGSGLSDGISRLQSWITYTTAGILSQAPRPPSLRSSLQAAAPRPVLVIAGRDEITAGRYFKSGSPGNVQLVAMPDSAHTAGLRTHPAEWENAVIRFLALNLSQR